MNSTRRLFISLLTFVPFFGISKYALAASSAFVDAKCVRSTASGPKIGRFYEHIGFQIEAHKLDAHRIAFFCDPSTGTDFNMNPIGNDFVGSMYFCFSDKGAWGESTINGEQQLWYNSENRVSDFTYRTIGQPDLKRVEKFPELVRICTAWNDELRAAKF